MSDQIRLLLEVYDQAFDHTAWHGTNLRGSIKGLKLPELSWRPQSKRHDSWEIILHCAYWKYVVWRRLTQKGKRGDFPRNPSDWPCHSKKPNNKEWQSDLELLVHYHELLRDAIFDFPENKLYRCPKGSKVNYIQTIYGVASHDLYHAGQIQLIKRMVRNEQK
jgi:hypothetical protein